MTLRLIVAALALIASFLGGVKLEANRRDAAALKVERAAAKETQRLIELNYRAGAQLTATTERERVVTRTIKEQVHVYLPAPDPGCPVLPAAWRLLHDSAASGTDPAAQPRVDVPGPSPQIAAATVTENYGACRITAARLGACQEYVRTVVQPPGLEADHAEQARPYPRP
jgi:hypothetical protein